MKKLLRSLFAAAALLGLCSAFAADNQYIGQVVFTGVPADGDTLTVNGSVRTFKTVVVTPATQVQIGASAVLTADNLSTHLRLYPFTGITTLQLTTTNYLVAEKYNFVITVSDAGANITTAQSITLIDSYGLALPLATAEANAAHRINMANWLVEALRDYATTVFPSGESVMTNYVDLTTGKTITGPNFFTGATILSNLNQLFAGGTLSNIYARTLYLDRSKGETNNAVYFREAGGGSIISAMAPDGSGYPSLYAVTALTDNLTSPLGFNPAAANILNAAIGNFLYGQLVGMNNWTGTNSFTKPAFFFLFSGIGTNLSLYGVTNLNATNVNFFGLVSHTNANPKLEMWATGAAANEKGLRISSPTSGGLRVDTLNDDGTVGEAVILITRVGSDAQTVTIGGGTTFVTQGPLLGGGRIAGTGQVAATTFLGAGDDEMLPPTGLTSGLILTNVATEASADPANAVAEWSSSGEKKYRMAGSGTNHRMHNAAAQVVGAGTDYPFTGSYAQVTFGSGGNTITLPSGGTYLVTAVATIDNGATANDNYALKLYNATAAADITSSERQISHIAASQRAQVVLQNVVTVSASTTVHLYGRNVTAARGSIDSEQTSLSYVRLY